MGNRCVIGPSSRGAAFLSSGLFEADWIRGGLRRRLNIVNPAFIQMPQIRVSDFSELAASGIELRIMKIQRRSVGLAFYLCGLMTVDMAFAESHDFVVAGNDGYGVQECLAEAGPCGQVVADAWCEAHGLGHALRFGAQSTFTGGRPTNVASTDEPYVIRCGN
jgi:hypothetical protein